MDFVLRRLGFYLIAFFFAATFNFFLPRLMPGDPITVMFSSQGNPLPVESIAALKETFGFVDGPLYEQYFIYLKSVVTWDLGSSVKYFPQTVNEVLGRSMVWTLFLVGTSTLISFFIGSISGIIAAWNRGGWLDSILSPLSLVLQSIPAVVLALLFMFVFGVALNWLPYSYAYDIELDPAFSWEYISSVISHATMPIISLVIVQIGGYLLTIRNNLINLLGEDYIVMGRAKGLSETRVMFNYGARNALLPSITAFAMTVGVVLGGSLITEVVFNYPGLGNTLFEAIVSRDYPVIQGQLLIMTLAMLSANFVADMAYVYLDPRLRRD
ncbi:MULTISPECIES: ABC transporter permease [Motilimonas]|uniref:ABC transporter permease n=1 Tax=Motilimonas cestriensis TaxID=2742685 RepID=A0ABS8W9S7_9GAMM|nr:MULTISPECIES: ABC transporter permease [Motilimonas]MCE0555406.1 ABC transporter permease [Motilimonas sp. E26]MCE2594852.1 ABC transporter permease [Motilimonas cestriensis]MDO6527633.1 ABC transporter permease [Motilimonas sp. 1_MG-2023]